MGDPGIADDGVHGAISLFDLGDDSFGRFGRCNVKLVKLGRPAFGIDGMGDLFTVFLEDIGDDHPVTGLAESMRRCTPDADPSPRYD